MKRGQPRMPAVALMSALAVSMSPVQAGDDFYLVDNNQSDDRFLRSNTDDVPGGELITRLPSEPFWADMSPSDRVNHLFLVRADEDAPVLYRIRQTDGALVTKLRLDREILSIGYDLSTDVLYGINTAEGRLFSIDVDTGTTTAIGDTEVDGLVTGLVFDPETRLLFATVDDAPRDDLYVVDPVDAVATLIGSTGLIATFDLAWNPSDAGLYVTDADTDSLYTIDRVDASVELVGGPYGLSTHATGLSFGSQCALQLEVDAPTAGLHGILIGYLLTVRHNVPTAVTALIRVRVVGADGRSVAERSHGPVRFEPGSSLEIADTLRLPAGVAEGPYTVVAAVSRMHGIHTITRPVALP